MIIHVAPPLPEAEDDDLHPDVIALSMPETPFQRSSIGMASERIDCVTRSGAHRVEDEPLSSGRRCGAGVKTEPRLPGRERTVTVTAAIIAPMPHLEQYSRHNGRDG